MPTTRGGDCAHASPSVKLQAEPATAGTADLIGQCLRADPEPPGQGGGLYRLLNLGYGRHGGSWADLLLKLGYGPLQGSNPVSQARCLLGGREHGQQPVAQRRPVAGLSRPAAPVRRDVGRDLQVELNQCHDRSGR
jgi:hypothetical protein